MSELTNFVIVSIPRSGSNYLCGMLNSHPQILCHHELYHSNAIYYALDHRGGDLDLGDVDYRNGNPLRFLSSVWENRFSNRSVGFKIFPGHNDLVLKALLSDIKVKKIILERPNLLRVFVSKIVAETTGIYSSLQGSMRIPKNITVNISEFDAFIEEVGRYFFECKRTMEETHQSYINVKYPDIVENPEMTRIQEFLEVTPDTRLSTPHKRQGIYRLQEIIGNYEEVRCYLESNLLSHYLEEKDE